MIVLDYDIVGIPVSVIDILRAGRGSFRALVSYRQGLGQEFARFDLWFQKYLHVLRIEIYGDGKVLE